MPSVFQTDILEEHVLESEVHTGVGDSEEGCNAGWLRVPDVSGEHNA
jgi:hypothetical protein